MPSPFARPLIVFFAYPPSFVPPALGKAVRCLATLLVAGALAATAYAQTVTFTGVQTTSITGLDSPTGVAVDLTGNIFIADYNNSQVVELPAGGGAQTILGKGFLYQPASVAVDAAGDLFVANTSGETVVEFPVSGGSPITRYTATGNTSGVAVDAAGDLFIVDRDAGVLWEIPAGGSPTSLVTGLSSPEDVAVDANGDVFVAEYKGNDVQELPAGSGATTTLGTVLNGPFGMATDTAGDVFIADIGNNRVVKTSPPFTSQTSLGSGLAGPFGVGVDGAGDVFIADSGHNRVVELKFAAPNFGNVNVCPASQTIPSPCNATLTLNYYVAADTTFAATPTVVTQGTPNLDFTLGPDSTCTGMVSADTTCTVNVTFTPLAPGLRMGEVQLFDGSANLLATTMLQGNGQGPAIAFGPGIQATLTVTADGQGLIRPQGVAVDAAGNVFIADSSNHRVVKIPTGGGSQVTLLGSPDLSAPTGLAVDGAGNVFVADDGNRVVKIPAGGGAPTNVDTGSFTLSGVAGVALDGAGDVFIADGLNNRVLKVPASGGSPAVVDTGGYTLTAPGGLAVDEAGDVFIANTDSGEVIKVPAGGGSPTIVGGLNYATGLAVDAAGNVFIADPTSGDNRVVEIPAGCSTNTCQTTVGNGLSRPYGVATDGAGNIFIADTWSNRVLEVNRSQAPSLSFASTAAGSTSSDSPQTVTIQNVGNQALNAVTPGLVVTGPDFIQVAGTGMPADCNSTFALTPGASCNLSISFQPQSVGPLNSTAVFTDDTLNTSPSATQTIGLQGAGVVGTVSVPNVVNETQAQATTDITNAGLAVGTVTMMASGTVPSGSVISENPTAGSLVSPGSAVNLLVSTGPVSVPNVVSETQTQATTDITNVGLVVGTVTMMASGTVPSGSVISENPTAGSLVSPGSAVNLVISSGPISVPNVVNQTQAAATTAITNAGLVVGTVTMMASGTVPSGSVISENPIAGSLVSPGSAVDLVVSSGPAQYLLTTAANPSIGGTVAPPSGTYSEGTVVNLTATPNSGYVFSSWSGNVANASSGSTTVTMNSAQTVTANFTPTTTQAPAFTSAISATFTLGVNNSFLVTTSGAPVPTLTWTGHPPIGVNMVDNHDGTVTLSGTPMTGATAHLVIKATNGVGSAAIQHFTLLVRGPLAKVIPGNIIFKEAYLNKARSAIVTLKNIGNAPLNIDDVTLTLGEGTNLADFSLQSACLGTQVLPLQTCKITVVSTSVDVGSLSATLNIMDNAPASPQVVSLSATVINPQASFDPTHLLFGKIALGNNSTLSTTLTNTGTTTLNFNGATIAGLAAADYAPSSDCPASLAPTESCTISVTFTPGATGSRPANLIVVDNVGSSNAKKAIPLAGRGE